MSIAIHPHTLTHSQAMTLRTAASKPISQSIRTSTPILNSFHDIGINKEHIAARNDVCNVINDKRVVCGDDTLRGRYNGDM